jgi:hypothetical protein
VTYLLLGIDSFVGSFAVRGAGTPRGSRARLALAFGTCDGAATVAGSLAGPHFAWWADRAGPTLVAAYAVYLVVAVTWTRATPAGRAPYVLAVLMSLDNLTYGAASGHTALALVPQALLLGLISAACAFGGLTLRDVSGTGSHRSSGRGAVAGLALVVFASSLI